MCRAFKSLVICVLLILAVGSSYAQMLKIGLTRFFDEVQAVTISSDSDLRITTPSGAQIALVGHGDEVSISVSASGIPVIRGINTPIIAEKIRLSTSSPDGLISVSSDSCKSAQYRGSIVITRANKGMLLVNEVDIEDYLKGVLPSEMPPGFNVEALKAQAVAARTYAWSSTGRHFDMGYNLCDSTHCQVYPGASGENPSTSQAVKDTAGLVMTYQGKLISAQYCSDCGGTTETSNQPYLTSVSDKPNCDLPAYCEHNGHTWVKSWPVEEFEKLLVPRISQLSGIKAIYITQTSSTGRVKEIKIDADTGGTTISGVNLRILLGATVIRSTMFSVSLADGNVTFEGRGYGHGIGLCQYGANGLASPSYSYSFEQILKHYYKDIEIVSILQ